MVKGAAAENVPVIVEVNKPGGGSPFIVAKGYVNNIMVIVNPVLFGRRGRSVCDRSSRGNIRRRTRRLFGNGGTPFRYQK